MVDNKWANIFSTFEVELNSKYLDTWKNFVYWIFILLRSILYSLNWLCLKCLHASVYRLHSVKFAYIERENICIHVYPQLMCVFVKRENICTNNTGSYWMPKSLINCYVPIILSPQLRCITPFCSFNSYSERNINWLGCIACINYLFTTSLVLRNIQEQPQEFFWKFENKNCNDPKEC